MTTKPTKPDFQPLVCQDMRIGSRWSAANGGRFTSTSPVDGSVVWEGNQATAVDIGMAAAAARAAAPSWGAVPLPHRFQLVSQFADLVDDRRDEFAQLISRETGKPLWEAKTEVAGVCGKAALAIEAINQRRAESGFDMDHTRAVTRFKPFGVLGVLGPFNFPAHLPNGHIIPALIAGNTIVFKPSEQAPAVGQWMTERWVEAGLPAGVLNLVQGGREAGAAVASESQLDGLLFTGSSAAGKALHETFAKWPQKMLALEMGGNNPLILHRADDLRAAAYLTVQSAFITAGQRCTCARRLIIVDSSNTDALVAELADMIERTRVGFWYDDPQPFMGTVISGPTGRALLDAQQSLIDAGGRPILKMESRRQCDALLSPGVIDVTEIVNRDDREVFGPLLQISRVKDFQTAMDQANDTQYGLSAGLISNDRDCYEQFFTQIRAGVVNWNRPTTGASGKLPFGGCGLSGNNRPSGFYAADYCNWPVASMESEVLALPDQPVTGIDLG